MAVAVTPEAAADKIRAAARGLDERGLSRKFIKRARLACLADVRENFDKSHGPDGQAWKPLAFPRPNSKGSDKPLLNFGLLRGSVTGTGPGHIEEVTDFSLTIGTNRQGARLMQEGGTVTPTKGKALTIPLTKEAMGFKARDFPRPLFVLWRNGADSGALAERPKPKGKRGKGKRSRAKAKPTLKLHYALVRSVTITARRFLGFGPRLIKRLDNIAVGVFGKALFGSGGGSDGG